MRWPASHREGENLGKKNHLRVYFNVCRRISSLIYVSTHGRQREVGADITPHERIRLDDSFFKTRRHLEQGMVPALGPIASTLADELTLTPVPGAMSSAAASPPSVCATFGRLVGQSGRMRKVIDQLRVVAPQNTTLLLEGESGTGKELAAEGVHAASQCRKGPFVVVDCAAVPRNLIEAELFGHERGAFTGAVQSREGAFLRADGGTVFLDEIGELELDIQPRLLRVIETRAIKPVGGSVPRRLNVRIIAATNRDLSREAEQGR